MMVSGLNVVTASAVFAYGQVDLSTTYLNFCYQIMIFVFDSRILDIGRRKLPVGSQKLDASH